MAGDEEDPATSRLMLPPTGKKFSEDKKTDFDRNSFDKRSEHDDEVL